MIQSPDHSTQDIPRSRVRRGFALMLTLGAIVVIGLLIGGVHFMTQQQVRGGAANLRQEQAFRMAEAKLNERLAFWANSPDSVPALRGQTITTTRDSAGMRFVVSVTRLSDTLYQVTSKATTLDGVARNKASRHITQIVRVRGPAFNIRGALTVRGELNIRGTPEIHGEDFTPGGWGCGAAKPTLPGIAASDISQVDANGKCGDFQCVTGSPPVKQDSLAGQMGTYTTFGDFNWAQLVSMADIRVTAAVAPEPVVDQQGRCVRSMTNWGDPRRLNPAGACESYFPIIYYPGTAHLSNGTGQGILLVEGDLEVQGNFVFYGPVIIRGILTTAGTGGHFNGAVMAANANLDENEARGNAVVNFSSCAVEKAVEAQRLPRDMPQRGWSEVF